MVGAPLLSIRIVLGVIFLIAGVSKLSDSEGSRRAVEQFGVPRWSARAVAVVLPFAELAIAIGLLVDPSARYAAVGALVLLIAFVVGVARAVSKGQSPDCHCLGQLHSEPAGPSTIARNLILVALALAVVAAGAGPGIPGGVEQFSGPQAELAVVSALAILLALATAWLWGDRQRARAALAGTVPEAAPKPGLQRGTAAPDFDLTPVRGAAATLGDLTKGLRPTVLIFLSTACGSCAQLLPELGRWQDSVGDTVALVPIFSGDRADIERLSQDHGLRIALAEQGRATFERFALHATPSAVLIDPDGTIAGAAAEGSQAVEALVRAALGRADPPAPRSATNLTRAGIAAGR